MDAATSLTTYFVMLRPPFSIRLNQFLQIFLLKPAPICKFFTGVSSTNKYATSLRNSFSQTFALFLLHISFLHLFFFLTLPGTFGRNYLFSLFSLLSGLSEYLVIHFFWAIRRPMSWPDKLRCFSHLPFLGGLSLLSFVPTHLFFRRTGVLFHQKLMHTSSCCIYRRTYAASSGSLSSLPPSLKFRISNSYFSRIDWIEKPLCSACVHSIQDTYHFILAYRATNTFGRLLFGNC